MAPPRRDSDSQGRSRTPAGPRRPGGGARGMDVVREPRPGADRALVSIRSQARGDGGAPDGRRRPEEMIEQRASRSRRPAPYAPAVKARTGHSHRNRLCRHQLSKISPSLRCSRSRATDRPGPVPASRKSPHQARPRSRPHQDFLHFHKCQIFNDLDARVSTRALGISRILQALPSIVVGVSTVDRRGVRSRTSPRWVG